MKIAWLTNNINQLGGVEQVICGLSSYFSAELKHDVEIISLNSQENHVFYALDASVRICHCGQDWREQTFRKLLKLVGNILRELDADILLTCHPTISYAALLNRAKFRGKIVVTDHSACDFYTKKRLYCNALLFRLADQLVVLNENDRRIYQKFGCHAIVIPNANYRCATTRATLQEKMITAAGRLETVKGFDQLLEAFSQIAEKHPDWKLCICGGGSQEAQLRQQIQELGLSKRVMLPGAVKNMQDYYQSASIFALSSRSEGFSLVLVEAASAGLPAVSFDLPAPGDILKNGGDLLVPQGDVCGFAEKLDALMSSADLRRKIGNEALAMSERYRVPTIADQWMRLFANLTAGKS